MRWSPFADITDYYDSSEKQFMINYRVQNIEGLVDQLRQNGVTIVDEIQSYAYDKFVNIMDPEGNKIELWEPVDRFFTEMWAQLPSECMQGRFHNECTPCLVWYHSPTTHPTYPARFNPPSRSPSVDEKSGLIRRSLLHIHKLIAVE